jgi:DNA polymerase III delta prime subunit
MYKYAPRTLEEFDMEDKSNLHDFTHLLLMGGSRTGKTTLAALLAQNVSRADNILHINSLKEQGVQYYRNEVKCFCQTTSLVKKMVVIDSLDEMNEQAQQIFLNYVDKYGHNVSFIAIGSNPQKIIEGIYSRFVLINLKPVRPAYLQSLMERIVAAESIQLDTDVIPYLMILSNYNIGTALNYLEKYKILDIPITKSYVEQTHTDIHAPLFQSFLRFLLDQEKDSAQSCIVQLYSDGYSISDILDAFYVFLKGEESPFRYELIKTICKYIVILNTMNDHPIELLFFVQLFLYEYIQNDTPEE